jgi:AP-3 complex subunit beta
MSFKKGLTDLSPYVRKAVAISIDKCHRLDPTQDHILLEIVEVLLTDKSTIVLGPTIAVMNKLFPDRLDLLHKHFKKLCRLLVDADEWSQLQILHTMIRYCRVHFPYRPTFEELDGDLQLFISSIKSLLHSQNPLVVLNISVFFYDLRYVDLKISVSKSLLRCLTRPKQEQYMILVAIKELVINDKAPWIAHVGMFQIYKGETIEIARLKLEILELLATEENSHYIFEEFKACVYSSNTNLASNVVRVWKRFATRTPAVCSKTIQVLISLLSHTDSNLVGEAVIAIRKLIQESETETISKVSLIAYLVSIYSSISVPLARASILWLVRNQPLSFRYYADCLRISLLDFCNQDCFVKREILQIAVLLKISTLQSDPKYKFVQLSYDYAFKLAKYDSNVDVRDHARLYDGLVQHVTPEAVPELIKLLTKQVITKDRYETIRILY